MYTRINTITAHILLRLEDKVAQAHDIRTQSRD